MRIANGLPPVAASATNGSSPAANNTTDDGTIGKSNDLLKTTNAESTKAAATMEPAGGDKSDDQNNMDISREFRCKKHVACKDPACGEGKELASAIGNYMGTTTLADERKEYGL